MGKQLNPLKNFFAGGDEYPKVFSLLEVIQFVSLFLGSGYGWLITKFNWKETKLLPLTAKNRAIYWGTNGEMRVLDFATASYYNLNETGCKIWEMLKAGKNTDEIVDSLSQEYQINREDLKVEVMEFVNLLNNTFRKHDASLYNH